MVYNDIGEEIQRLFDPSDDPCTRSIPLDQLVVYDAQKQVS
jgi:ribonuclease HI